MRSLLQFILINIIDVLTLNIMYTYIIYNSIVSIHQLRLCTINDDLRRFIKFVVDNRNMK